MIGKDILRFHAVYWPAFLMAAQLPLPKTIFAHGWWTIRGEKISKSMPATRIDPVKLADALGVGPLGRAIGIDAMRYYLLREVPLGLDGDFTFESLFGRFNAELANDLGNLVNRSLTMLNKFLANTQPIRDARIVELPAHRELESSVAEAIAATTAAYDAIAPSKALEATWKLVRDANKYVDATQPWVLARDPAKHPELALVLHELAARDRRDRRARRTRAADDRRDAARVGRHPAALRGKWPSVDDLLQPIHTDHAREGSDAAVPAARRRGADEDLRVHGAARSCLARACSRSPPPRRRGRARRSSTPTSRSSSSAPARCCPRSPCRRRTSCSTCRSTSARPSRGRSSRASRRRSSPTALVGKQVIVVANLGPAKARRSHLRGHDPRRGRRPDPGTFRRSITTSRRERGYDRPSACPSHVVHHASSSTPRRDRVDRSGVDAAASEPRARVPPRRCGQELGRHEVPRDDPRPVDERRVRVGRAAAAACRASRSSSSSRASARSTRSAGCCGSAWTTARSRTPTSTRRCRRASACCSRPSRWRLAPRSRRS